MRIRLIAVGQRLPAWIDAGCDEYLKRLPREWNFQLVALKPASRGASGGGKTGSVKSGGPDDKTSSVAMLAEARMIVDAIAPGMRRVILDERGCPSTSRELAERIGRWQRDGRDIAMIIGGADGLDPAFKSTADESLSLSAMTLPHGLARVVLIEQLYRASSVMKGHPYHRD